MAERFGVIAPSRKELSEFTGQVVSPNIQRGKRVASLRDWYSSPHTTHHRERCEPPLSWLLHDKRAREQLRQKRPNGFKSDAVERSRRIIGGWGASTLANRS